MKRVGDSDGGGPMVLQAVAATGWVNAAWPRKHGNARPGTWAWRWASSGGVSVGAFAAA